MQLMADKRLVIIEYAHTNSLDNLLIKVLSERAKTRGP